MRRNRILWTTYILCAAHAQAQSLPWPFFAWTRESQPAPTFRPQFASTIYQTQPSNLIANENSWNPQWNQIRSEFIPSLHTRLPSQSTQQAQISRSPSDITIRRYSAEILPTVTHTQTATSTTQTRISSASTQSNYFGLKHSEGHLGVISLDRDNDEKRDNESSQILIEARQDDAGVTTTTTVSTTTILTTESSPLAHILSTTETIASSNINSAYAEDSSLVSVPIKDEAASDKEDQQSKPHDIDFDGPYYSGWLPERYFDQATTSTTTPPINRADNTFYRPQKYNLTELLSQPPVELSPYVQKPKEVNIYCYPFEESEILGKCREGVFKQDATGVMLPMMNEIQTPKSARYYDNVRRLKNEKTASGEPIKVYGVAYDNPAWDVIGQILAEHTHLFDGLILEWVGTKACVWNMKSPTKAQVDAIAEHAGLPIQYFARQQDCDPYLLGKSSNGGSFFNPNDSIDMNDLTVTKGAWPKFLKYIFPCFQGEEGPCYHAIRNHPDKICSSELQKFAYSPFEMLGGLMMYLKNETCHGLSDHDLYSVV